MIGGIQGEMITENDEAVIDFVVPGGPADQNGLIDGDKIIRINDLEINSWSKAVSTIEKYPNQNISIDILRDDIILNKDISLISRPNLDSGRVDQEVGALGVSKKQISKTLSFSESLSYGIRETKWAMVLMTSSLKMIFQGNVSRDDVGSVIMIGDMAGQAAQAGLVPFLFLMALISVNLAYINILPIPGLDGGHIAIILIEVLMGRSLSVKARIRIQSVGMFLLFSLMIFLILNDIIRVFS